MLTKRQLKFAECYAVTLNATTAALSAGYNSKTAYSQGSRLLKNVEIQKYINELTENEKQQRIANIEELRERLTAIVRDDNVKTSAKIKAIETLLKSLGGFAPDSLVAIQNNIGAAESNSEDENEPSCRIMLPWNRRGDNVVNAIQTADGDIIPFAGHEHSDLWIYLPYGETMELWDEDANDIDIEDEEIDSYV